MSTEIIPPDIASVDFRLDILDEVAAIVSLRPELGLDFPDTHLDTIVSPIPALGQFKINLSPFVRPAGLPMKDFIARAASIIGTDPRVERVVGVPPHLYITLAADRLQSLAVGSIERFLDRRRNPDRALVNFSFCSPNANKPLHLGHARNFFLGNALSTLYEFAGYRVLRTCVFSDFGIHVAKALIGLRRSNILDVAHEEIDHAVGKSYASVTREIENGDAELERDALDLLRLWYQGDQSVSDLGRKVCAEVVRGIRDTFDRCNCRFDHFFFESDNLSVCREITVRGFERGVLQRTNDGGVYIEIAAENNRKVMLERGDGTPLYMLQVLATAVRRFREYPVIDIYNAVTGASQRENFRTFVTILNQLGYDFTPKLGMIPYGLVRSSDGAFSSRSGTAISVDVTLEMLEARCASMSLIDRYAPSVLGFYMLRHKRGKDVVFDFDGLCNSALPGYIGIVREVQRLLGEASERNERGMGEWNLSDHLMKLLTFPYWIQKSVRELDPANLANYLINFAAATRGIPVDPSTARLREISVAVINRGLELLGLVPVPANVMLEADA